MIEERLKELSLTPDKQKKAQHFQQIEGRLQRSRQRTKWQVGLILALVCLLIVFFIGTGEITTRLQSSGDTNITRAYITLGEGNPYSALQNNVDKVDNAKWIRFMTQVTEGMTPVDIKLFNQEADYTMRLDYQYGPRPLYGVYTTGDGSVYFEQKETGQLYKLQETFEEFHSKAIEPLHKNNAIPYILGLLAAVFIVNLLAERKWNKKDEQGRKPPKHSHSSQTVIELIMAGLVIIFIVFVYNIHFFVPAGIIMTGTAVNCLIESRKGKSRDRQLMLTMNSLQYLAALAIIYYL